jgi:tetratricopeptide (TPR) repeat protein
MSSDRDDTIDDAESERTAAFLSRCVEEILTGKDAASFFEWIDRFGPELLGGPFLQAPHDQARRALSIALGSAIWNATPRPDNDYRPRPLPPPERNEPCPCGSGRKYKKCCAHAPTFPPIAVEDMWTLVVEHLPVPQLIRVAREVALPVSALEGAARRLQAENRPKTALKLLAPLFDAPERLDERHEGALHLLFDLLEERGRAARKHEMIERLEQRLRPPLRAVVLQRRASIAHGEGQTALAWDYFHRARKDDPEHPSLASLEILLLAQEGRAEQAAERARFWLAQLRRQRSLGTDHIVALLEQVAVDPLAALAGLCDPGEAGAVRRLVEMVRKASGRPLPVYSARAHGGELSLATPDSLLQLEKQWERLWRVDKPFSIHFLDETDEVWDDARAGKWLALLERYPEAFDSLSILDDLALAANALTDGESRAVDDALVLPLASRGQAILEHSLSDHPVARVPWPDLDNRPALRLVALKIAVLERRQDPVAAMTLMERLLDLNPADHHGYRASLINHYLRARQDERALEVAGRYPEDMFAETTYGRVLALLRLQRRGEALPALKDAVEVCRFVPRYLLDPEARPPKIDETGFTVGGRDQAWLYRAAALDLWRDTPGALEWLAECAPTLVKRRARMSRR